MHTITYKYIRRTPKLLQNRYDRILKEIVSTLIYETYSKSQQWESKCVPKYFRPLKKYEELFKELLKKKKRKGKDKTSFDQKRL